MGRLSKTGVKGVYWHNNSKWMVQIGFDKKNYTIGFYDTIEEAAHARKEAEEAKKNGTFPVLSTRWLEGYNHALQYYDAKGNLLVPYNYICSDGYKLGQWIFTQRSIKRGNYEASMHPKKKKLLDQIGMVWNVR